jgi:hypothetical protein
MRQAKLSTEIEAPAFTAAAIAQPIARPCPSIAAMFARAAAIAGLGRAGFVDDERRAATPHVVDCQGLNRDDLCDEPYRFETELQARVAWCDENGGRCEIEALRDARTKRVKAYRFRFERLADAVHFKMRFDSNL